MFRLLYIILVVFNFSISSQTIDPLIDVSGSWILLGTGDVETHQCGEECPISDQTNCIRQQNSACQCITTCCGPLLRCKYGFNCTYPCSNCQCNRLAPYSTNPCQEPCPSSTDPFCETFRDPLSCQCLTECCARPSCQYGYSECTSCNSCFCNLQPIDNSTTVKPSSGKRKRLRCFPIA